MANAEVNERNEKDGKSVSSGEEDENALLAEDGNDHDTTGAHAIAPDKLWEAIQGLQKIVNLLAGTSTCITDASLKRKVPQTSKAESKNDSDSDEANAILGEEEQDCDSSDKLLKEIEEEYNTADKTSPNINEHLANLINKRFAGKLKEAKFKERLELYVRPGNCEKLKVPLVNHELWGKLKPPVKSQDLRLANVQQTVVKATIALAEATEKISKVKAKMDGKPKSISSLTDSLALLGHATYEFSLRQIPVTDFLFRGDVQSSLKAIKECDKIASSVTKGHDYKQGYSGTGHQRPRNSKTFLGHSKSYNTFKKKLWASYQKRENSK
ncbi:hypothetical protein AWC38_SpisGene8893 [Stylophora pistillata]|uniref:Uncharacterized protein n=1 Tax=Stylophora pistillata TaxID=50429 RepID=A0A2B4SBG0_STYPI|nr:hypothetical protein AWC38_SpisGene8893 [Stylophora pistillata]